jgi:hypothetical protein
LKLSTKVVDVKRHIRNVLCLLAIKAWHPKVDVSPA